MIMSHDNDVSQKHEAKWHVSYYLLCQIISMKMNRFLTQSLENKITMT